MTATILISGKLQRDPIGKMSGKGNAYSMATVRVGQGEAAQFFKVFAFADEIREELLALGVGDSVSVSGPLRAEAFARDGEAPRVSLSIIADRLISAKRQKKERAAVAAKPRKAKVEKPKRALPEKTAACPFDDGVGL